MSVVRRIGLVVLGLAVGACLLAATASAESYEQVRSWEVDSPSGIAIDAQSNVYTVGGYPDDRVTKFSSDGRVLTSWGSNGDGDGQFNAANGIEIDRTGRVFVVDDGNYRIETFTPDGAFLGSTPAATPEGEVLADDIAFDAQNRAYVAHFGQFGISPGVLVFAFSPSGSTYIDSWGVTGAADGQLLNPRGVATDPQGNVWIADSDIPRIQRFTPSGSFISAFGQLGSDPGQLDNDLSSIDVDAQGSVYVLSLGADRVDKFSPDGTLITSFGEPGLADENLDCPRDLEVDDATGEVYVADGAAGACGAGNRVHVFAQTSGPGPDPGGNRVKIASKSLNYKKNKIKVKIKCLGSGQCKGKLQLKKGKKTKLAKGSYKLPAGKQKNFTAKPTKQGKRQLKRSKKKLKVTVELRPTGGGKKVTKKLRLKG